MDDMWTMQFHSIVQNYFFLIVTIDCLTPLSRSLSISILFASSCPLLMSPVACYYRPLFDIIWCLHHPLFIVVAVTWCVIWSLLLPIFLGRLLAHRFHTFPLPPLTPFLFTFSYISFPFTSSPPPPTCLNWYANVLCIDILVVHYRILISWPGINTCLVSRYQCS